MIPALSNGERFTEFDTVVPSAVGDLGAIVTVPTGVTDSTPGLVLVDGSGDGDRNSWGELPAWLADAGAVVLRHDKPGCGGAPGHWLEQSLEDRARETLAAVRVLREHPRGHGRPIGLYGISQGGWVALLAAALEPESVDFVVCDSGPGVTPARQERERLEIALRAERLDAPTIARAMKWVDERLARLRRGDSEASVLAEQARHAGEPWYDIVRFPYDTAESLRFVRSIMDFDPTNVMPSIHCPVLALFGAADALIPVSESVTAFAEHLPHDPRNGLAVFPSADHGLFVAEPRPGVPRREQLAPLYLPTVAAFLADRAAETAADQFMR
ncbi:alpha/beta hydrolase family protein [Humibacter ginsenosidimutans]|uniref:Alpha/beta hydrolase n=1 Tax=Humibacter ginsenosidimutans TaxID=2599293 RepID=A0A5B8M5Q8_9MICO|nr:alpha/beta hydrolase [Humibacter ginsenosidimutans]QDZ16118.1 alpha/beta hydrolase [Humibacter ginsenosidimutans]